MQLFEEISDVHSQISITSDSSNGCEFTSKHRQTDIHHSPDLLQQHFLKSSDVHALKTTLETSSNPYDPIEILLPSKERTLEFCPKRERINKIVSQMIETNITQNYLKQSNAFAGREDIYTAELELEKIEMNNLLSMAKSPYETSSSTEWNQLKETDSGELLEIIQKELNTLIKISPSTTLKVIELSDIIFHYKVKKCTIKFLINRKMFIITLLELKLKFHYNYHAVGSFAFCRTLKFNIKFINVISWILHQPPTVKCLFPIW